LSRIADKLARLHKISTPIGFGFATREAAERRMLLVASLDSAPTEEAVQAVNAIADALVLRGAKQPDGIDMAKLPAGCWIGKDDEMPEGLSIDACDFVISEVDGPASILAVEGLGWIAVVAQGVEASHLRAVAEVGAEAIVVSGNAIDLARLSTFVELRRMRLLSNRALFVSVDPSIDADSLVSLSRAGVEGLIVPADAGVTVLQKLRETLEATAARMRKSRKDEAVAIVGHVVGPSNDDVPDEEGDEEEEDD